MIYFFYLCPPLREVVANVRGIHAWRKEQIIDMTVSTLIEMTVEIREIALFNRATPGSSLVDYKVM